MSQALRDRVKGSSESCKESGDECGKEVIKDGVECEVCEKWFHLKCAGVAIGTYKALELDKSLHWCS